MRAGTETPDRDRRVQVPATTTDKGSPTTGAVVEPDRPAVPPVPPLDEGWRRAMDDNVAPRPPITPAHDVHAGGRSRALLLMATAIVGGSALARCLQRTGRLKHRIDDLDRLSRTDPLTGLSNRRDLEERLAAAVSAARRHRQPVSVLFVDVDGFKRINDRLGYDTGDEVLRAVGERMAAILRAEDVVGRWGGEEFLAVLGTTDLDGAVAVAERARLAIAGRPITVADADVEVTVSIGCATGPADPAELVRRAGGALRRAKRAGKNRVVAAPCSPD